MGGDSKVTAARGDGRGRKVRGVLFDMDGVLVDSYEVWFHLVNAAARDFAYPPVSRERFRQSWGQGVAADVEHFFPGHTPVEVDRYYIENFMTHAGRLRIDPDAKTVLTVLRRRGLPAAVITNTPGPLARDILDSAGLETDVVVGGDEVPKPKPAPDIVRRACVLLAIAPAEAVVVGDSRYDREAAAAAGSRFAGLGTKGEVQLKKLTDILDLHDFFQEDRHPDL